MEASALWVLAIASSGLFGVAGVLGGLWAGVRVVVRDEERFGTVSLRLDTLQTDMSRLKIEWGTTLEGLEDLASQVEKKRRRAAASESAVRQRDAEPEVPELTPAQQRQAIRRHLRSTGRSA